MRFLRTKGFLAVAAVGLSCLALLWLWPTQSYTCQLADGTHFTLSGIGIGLTNTYTHGTLPAKALGRLIPTNGVTLGPFKLQRPQKVGSFTWRGEEILSAELQVTGPSLRLNKFQNPPFYRNQRLLISGDDGFVYVQEMPRLQSYADGNFWIIQAETFPRDSKSLRFCLQGRDQPKGREWKELASFVVRNPKPAVVAKWVSQDASAARVELPENMEAQLGSIAVRKEPIHPDDIWENIARIALRVTRNGELLTNWGIHDVQITDATGNFQMLGASKTVTNGWLEYRGFRPLNPAVPWRLKVNFARESNIPSNFLHHFTIPSNLLAMGMQTNFAGLPVRLGMVNTTMLDIELLSKPPEQRLTLVSVQDDQGNNLREHSGSWGQHSFRRSLSLQRFPGATPVQLHVTIAIHPNYVHEFVIQPRWER